ITKPVFTFAVMRLYERGIIDLDKPLAEYLPFDLIKDHEYAGLITARHVLSHQTGFPNWARGGRLEFLFKPGTDFGYSGEGFEYLKRVLEQITGKEVNQILQEEVVEPLGLSHFYFQKEPYAARHKSHGHFNGYPGLIDLPEKPWVAGCLITNATAFMDFAQAIHERKGLKAETYAEMLKPQSSNPKGYQEGNWGYPEHMGLGWFVENTPYGQVFRHSGNNNDFRAMFRLYDKLGMAYMLIVNGNSGFYLINQLEKVLVDPEELGKKF
ncbi:MAG: serine hydrolase domain-containing protein, partial [Bacteroidota bacterium]